MGDEKRCLFCKKLLTENDSFGTCLRCKITGVDKSKKAGKKAIKIGAIGYGAFRFINEIKDGGDGNS